VGGNGRLQENERSGDICIDEVLSGISGDVRFVQRCRMNDRTRALHAAVDEFLVAYRTNTIGIWRWLQIDPDDGPALGAQAPHKGFTKVAGASRHQN
jgi:hypothetical protein